MDNREVVDEVEGRPDAGEAVSDQPRYNLRSRRGPEEVAELNTRQDLHETDGLDRRTGATVVINSVDAKISPSRRNGVSEVDRGRSPDRREPSAPVRERRASSESSDAGSEFSSAPGSPVSARGSQRVLPRVKTVADEASVRVEHRKKGASSRDDMLRPPSPVPLRRRVLEDESDAPRRSHRHRSPPLFEDMSWADLEAYRKIHIAFQQQRLLEPTVTSRVHELATRPDPSLLVGKRKEMDPLRAQKSTTFGTTVSQQPGRDGKHASRVSRRFSDTVLGMHSSNFKLFLSTLFTQLFVSNSKLKRRSPIARLVPYRLVIRIDYFVAKASR